MNAHDEQNRQFVETLVKLCDKDRGQAAALRRWWSPATEHQALPALGRLNAIGDWRRSCVAALYSEHPFHTEDGARIGQAALHLDKRSSEGEHSYDRHFRRLLAARNEEDLCSQLHRLIKRLKSDGISLDYAALLGDLRLWKDYSSRVKLRWAAEFWQAPADSTP